MINVEKEIEKIGRNSEFENLVRQIADERDRAMEACKSCQAEVARLKKVVDEAVIVLGNFTC